MKKTLRRLTLLGACIAALFAALAPQAYEVPVLMYHRVDPSGDVQHDSTVVTPTAFERQMEFLKVHRFKVLPLAELAQALRDSKPLPSNAVVITFDDGTLDNMRFAFPILKKLNFPATIFMITDNIGREGWLSEEDLRILDESGISIGSHTVHHAFLPDSPPEIVASELRDSKERLEALLKHPVTLLSYPAGGVTVSVARQAAEAGYTAAVTTNYNRSRRDPMAIHRIKAKEGDSNLFGFWVKTSGFYHLGKKRIVRG